MSSAYLRLLFSLLEILIPACASSSLAFYMMYSAYKLNKQCDNIQTWCNPVPSWNQSVFPCPVLSVASWLAYTLLRRRNFKRNFQIFKRRIFKKNKKKFPQFVVIHTVKDFGVVNTAEADVFLELSCFFYDPMDVGNLISCSSAFLNPAWTSGSSQFTYCWSMAWRILSITLLVCEMSAVVQ